MNITIIGAGRIGRGYVSYLLLLNKCKITYFDIEDTIDNLAIDHKYIIHVLGDSSKNMIHQNFDCFYLSDINSLKNSIENSDYIFTAVGGKNLPSIGEKLGTAIRELLLEKRIHKTNIVTCENWINPAEDLGKAISVKIDKDLYDQYIQNIGISESVIVATGTGCPNTDKANYLMDTWIQDIRYLPIDASRLIGDYKKLEYFEYEEHFDNLLTQKLYTNNTSCTAMSYIGLLYGYTYLCDACNDEYLITVLDELYKEINIALIDGMGFDKDSQLAFSKRAKQKYTDKNIIDPMTRIARDPIRKLKPKDRFITPARYALKVGYKPWAIARGIGAALYYESDNDDSANELANLRKTVGVEYILKNICELSEDEELYSLILHELNYLKEQGLICD